MSNELSKWAAETYGLEVHSRWVLRLQEWCQKNTQGGLGQDVLEVALATAERWREEAKEWKEEHNAALRLYLSASTHLPKRLGKFEARVMAQTQQAHTAEPACVCANLHLGHEPGCAWKKWKEKA